MAIFAMCVFALPTQAQLSSEGPFCGKWISSDGSNGGTLRWSNPGSAQCDESAAMAQADIVSGYKYTQYLRLHNFGFSIPDDATIRGIEVVVIRKADKDNALVDRTVKLVKAGRSMGKNLRAPGLWEKDWTAAFYGGETELWGQDWTPVELNSKEFGVVLDVQLGADYGRPQIDEILVTVHYDQPRGQMQSVSHSGGSSKFTCTTSGS